MDGQMTCDRMTGESQPDRKPMVQEAWDLVVYKKFYDISLEIHQATKKFPRDERFEMAGQMRRCSKSIGANLAEGFAKQAFSKAEFKRYITIAIGLSAGIQVWSQYAQDLGYISEAQAKTWKEKYKNIARMLQRLHMSIS